MEMNFGWRTKQSRCNLSNETKAASLFKRLYVCELQHITYSLTTHPAYDKKAYLTLMLVYALTDHQEMIDDEDG